MLFKGYDKVEEVKVPTAVVKESETSIVEITNHVGGYPWTVDYFNNIVERDDVVSQIDTSTPVGLQSYRKIEDLEIKLTSPLSSEDMESLTGEAYINIGSKIYKHDMFVATLKGGRPAIFQIDTVKDRKYETNEIALVEFSILTYIVEGDKTYENLVSKIATNYVYNEEHKFSNSSPIITVEEDLNYDRMKKNLRVFLNNYASKFLDENTQVLTLKYMNRSIVDAYLNDFAKRIFSDDSAKIKSIRDVETSEPRSEYSTIFSVLYEDIDLAYAKKLKFTKGIFDPFLRTVEGDVMSTSASDNAEVHDINGETYFIREDFYKNDYVTADDFELMLLEYIKGVTPNAKDLEDMIINMSTDKDDYFKRLILLFMYKVRMNSILG